MSRRKQKKSGSWSFSSLDWVPPTVAIQPPHRTKKEYRSPFEDYKSPFDPHTPLTETFKVPKQKKRKSN